MGLGLPVAEMGGVAEREGRAIPLSCSCRTVDGYGYTEMDGSKGKTNPLTARQLSNPPRCAAENCQYLIHADPANNGGAHCCGACKAGTGHGASCHKLHFSEVMLRARHGPAPEPEPE